MLLDRQCPFHANVKETEAMRGARQFCFWQHELADCGGSVSVKSTWVLISRMPVTYPLPCFKVGDVIGWPNEANAISKPPLWPT